MNWFLIFLSLGALCFIAAHVSVAIRNGRIMHIVSGRPFAPKIPVKQSDGDDEGKTQNHGAVGAMIMAVVVFCGIAWLVGGTDGVNSVLTFVSLLVIFPVTASVLTMMLFNCIDCVDDFTRFSAKSVGAGTLFLLLTAVNI